MKKQSKRKASIYLVRWIEESCHDDIPTNFVELFFNKKDALNFQKHNGGVLTQWSYQEQIVLPRGRK